MISPEPIKLFSFDREGNCAQISQETDSNGDVICVAEDSLAKSHTVEEIDIASLEREHAVVKTNTIATSIINLMCAPGVFLKWLCNTLYDLLGIKHIKCVVDLFTPKGFRGMVTSSTGYCLGTFYTMQGAPYVSNTLIEKTMATVCSYVNTRAITQTLLTAGGKTLWGPFIQPTLVIMGGVAGSYALVFIGNYVYKLCFDNPIEKKLIEEWKEAAVEMISEESSLDEID